MGSHTPGYNHLAVGVCLLGGRDCHGAISSEFTDAQMEALAKIGAAFLREWPEARIVGHNELKGYVGKSSCPAVDMNQVHQRVGQTKALMLPTLSELTKGKYDHGRTSGPRAVVSNDDTTGSAHPGLSHQWP